jgi:hypothetical protein
LDIENPQFRFSLCRGVSRRSLKLRGDVTDDKLHFVSAGDDGGECRDNYRQQGESADPTRAYAALFSAITSHSTRFDLSGVLGYKAGELCFAHGVNHLRASPVPPDVFAHAD